MPIFVYYVYAWLAPIVNGMCTGKQSLEVYAVAYINRYTLPHRVQKVNVLTLVVCKKDSLTLHMWKIKCPGTHHPSAKNLILTGATGASEAYGSTGSKI